MSIRQNGENEEENLVQKLTSESFAPTVSLCEMGMNVQANLAGASLVRGSGFVQDFKGANSR
jgi:hypothetical protein